MSVLIKGMEMPKPGAYTCELGVLDDTTAVLTIYMPINEPQKSYTLVPVPDHGRLISADLLKADFTGNFVEAYPPGLVWAMIDDAPTIIPADKEAEP